MFKRCSLVLFIGFCTHYTSFGQIEGSNIILSGGYARMAFDCKGMHYLINPKQSNILTSSISDTFGNLLFYVNDGIIYDNTDTKIATLDSFSESTGADFELIVPNPKDNYEYYIFYTWNSPSGNNKNFYSTYNVSSKKIISRGLLNSGENFYTAAKVPGRQKYWLIFTSDSGIACHLVDSNGVHAHPVYSKKLQSIWSAAKMNSECNQMAYYEAYGDSLLLTILDFDNSKGIFSQNVSTYIRNSGLTGGCTRGIAAISPSDNKLYLTIGCGCGACKGFSLIQCDISKDISDTIKKSALVLTNPDKNRYDWTYFINGPDCKLYNPGYEFYVDVINYPDLKGNQCDFTPGYKPNSGSGYNFINFLTRQDYWPSFSVDTGSNDLRRLVFSYNAPKTGERYQWDFGDPVSGSANHDTEKVTSHIFMPNQVYYVRLQVFRNGIHTTFTRMVCTKASLFTNVKDTTVCTLNNLPLNAGNPGSKFLWSNGDTTQTTTITQPGKYWLRISNDSATLNDTFMINIGSLSINLGPDKSICYGDSIRFSVNLPGASYKWSNGDTDSYLVAKQPGAYWVKVNSEGCMASDTVNVKILNPKVDIGPDLTICAGQNENLQSNISNASYLWSNADSSKSITINKSGAYWLRVDSGGCYGYDTMTLTVNQLPAMMPNPIYYFCIYDSANIQLTENGPYSYSWQDGDTSKSILVSKGGIYKVLLTNKYGCTAIDSFIVVSDCEDKIFIPNSFSPDGNSLNDFFKAIGSNIIDFQMDIYNRWGEHIFNSSNIDQGWDGSFKGETVSEGIYLYKISYKFRDQSKGTAKGTVMLFR